MNFLGISANYHDSAISLVDERNILFAAQEERFSRIKGDSRFPEKSIKEMYKFLSLDAKQIDVVSYYENPKLKLNRILKTFKDNFPQNLSQIGNFVTTYDHGRYFPLSKIKKAFPNSRVLSFEHHESHAASAFFTSGFDRAAVLVMDGVGEWASSSIFAGSPNSMQIVEQEDFPNSAGLFYATITSFCGFKVNSGEYKLMGLAPYGEPKYVNLLRDSVIKVNPTGKITLNLKYFGFTTELRMYNKEFENLFGRRARKAESTITKFDCDLAKSAQVIIEDIVVKKSLHALAMTGNTQLTLAGGVALNCVANSKILEKISANNIYVQPASGDAGGALGAAILASLSEKRSENIFYAMKGSFLGNSYDDSSIESYLTKENVHYKKMTSVELFDESAKMLVDGNAIGWFRGRMEFGPRALGGRSIIASATSPETQSRLNLKVKKRESFRPFAPVVLESKVSEWFEWDSESPSPFMLFTAQVQKIRLLDNLTHKADSSDQVDLISKVNVARSQIPAVTHVDNSARIQTVGNENPLHLLLERYYCLTGVPVLVNTSFNVRNEPIVESPQDAVRCFFTTDLDVLVIENFLIKKSLQDSKVTSHFQSLEYIGSLD
jgi:carbamoyltransferase